MNVRFLRAGYFVWIVFVLAGFLAWLALGLPHLLWSYEWRDDGQGYSPYAKRFYMRCTWVGPYGTFTQHSPKGGQCGWLRFEKKQRDTP